MRTTINIDDDIYKIAQSLAAEKGISMGAAISLLARDGLNMSRDVTYTKESGLPVFQVAENAEIITSEDIAAAEDEE